MLGRTLEPGAPAQPLHVDVKREANGWPLVGFIVMVDEFRDDNVATRFVPGSHRCLGELGERVENALEPSAQEVLGCGPAGSILVFDGSVWHGHSANRSAQRRRSIQGSFIPRKAINPLVRMRPDTLARIGPLAKYLLAVGNPPPN